MIKFFNKRTVIVILIAAVLFSVAPKTAFAVVPLGVPTVEMNPILVGEQTAVQTITSVVTGAFKIQQFFEWAFQVAAESLKRKLLNMMVDQIVAYIQGGGTPKFITNWPGFFRDAVDQAGGEFIQGMAGTQFCPNFALMLRASFIPVPYFNRVSCTLTQVGANWDAFSKNFSNGGWIAWQQMVLNPQNNVYGAYLMTWDQYNIQTSAAAKAAAAEAQAGKGFLSVKRCLEIDQAALNSCLNDCGSSTSCAANCQKTSCAKWETVTPGAVVGDLAAKAVGSDIDYIVNAKDLAAYVSAIFNAILNRMFAEGVGLLHTALSSGGGGGGGGGGSSAQTQCAELLGTAAYNDCITALQGGTNMNTFQKNELISLINQDLDYQNQLLGAKQATLTVLNQSADILAQLEDCQTAISSSQAQITAATIVRVQSAASTTVTQISQIQSDIIALQVKQQEVNAVEVNNTTQIALLWSQISGVVRPASTATLALTAQQEASQKQQDMSLYQQQLSACQLQQQQLQQRQQQQSSGG
ncbi:MAG: hypothetical protein NTV77_03725 [Candidatus Azambacteria bacterium]|nr:hypothetical protein [Candidatus Azambacteria bacterium]